MVGGLLLDKDSSMEEGRTRIRDRIRKRIGVLPAGIHPTRKYQFIYQNTLAFGKSLSLLCPYYQKERGTCTIWKFREAVCSTYFCKSIAGNAGKKFWESMKTFLMHLQRTLIEYSMLKMSLPANEILRSLNSEPPFPNLNAGDLDETSPSDEQYKEHWQSFVGAEEEFYINCYRHVSQLDKSSIEKLGGIEIAIKLKSLEEAFQNMMSIPSRLALSNKLTLKTRAENYLIPLPDIESSVEIPTTVIDLFTGKELTENIIEILKSQGIEVENEILLPLYHNKVLVELNENISSYDKTL